MNRLFLIIVCFVLVSFTLNGISQVNSYDSLKVNASMSNQIKNLPNSVFNITNNSELALHSINGNGSKDNPYIIGNFIINNCSSNEIGIDLHNTNQFFSLTNVTVLGCSIGIQLTNVTHGAIVNSKVQLSSSTGICFNLTSNSTILNSSVITSTNGFNITNSNFNTLINNSASSNIGINFVISNSSYNTLFNNVVTNGLNSYIGFQIGSSSNYNNLTQNTDTGYNGQNSCFQLINASNNTLVNNTAMSCTIGINLINSTNNTFTNNSVIFGSFGFKLSFSSSNTFTSNYGANNSVADYQDSSNMSNTLSNNNFTSNPTTGNVSTSNQTDIVPGLNFFRIKNLSFTIPEMAVIALIFLLPMASVYQYKRIKGNKKKFNQLDLKNDISFNNKTNLSLVILGPILALFATIYYSAKHRNLDYFDLKSNELRGKILTVLDDQHFIHFNKLKELLNCGVSILKWHIQVLHEFNIVNWEKIGQYKVIYLVEKPPKIKEVNLYYSMTNDKVVLILEQFLRIGTWKIEDLANKSLLRKDSVLHHCKKLASIDILKENPQTHEFTMNLDSKEIVKKILFKKVYYNSKKMKGISN